MKSIIVTTNAGQAIAEGRQTQLRRVVKPQPTDDCGPPPVGSGCGKKRWRWFSKNNRFWPDGGRGLACPYGEFGDRLFVREPWQMVKPFEDGDITIWEGTIPDTIIQEVTTPASGFRRYGRWHVWYMGQTEIYGEDRYVESYRSALSMPKWAARSVVEVTGVKVEKLQEVTLGDIRAEGIRDYMGISHAFQLYQTAWDCLCRNHSINGWHANPWVWVVTFRKLDGGVSLR